jgi:hypothetical protein
MRRKGRDGIAGIVDPATTQSTSRLLGDPRFVVFKRVFSCSMKKIPVPSHPTTPEPPLLVMRPERTVPQRMISCVICGSDTQSSSPEEMCWVCRRLKISAWRDVEQQMPAPE